MLGVAFVKPIVIVTTSIQGGLAAGVALAHLLELNQPAYEAMLGIGITALGLVFQIFTNLRKEEDEKTMRMTGTTARMRIWADMAGENRAQEVRNNGRKETGLNSGSHCGGTKDAVDQAKRV